MVEHVRPLTADEIETYRRDGVVCLRKVLNDEWVALVRGAVDDAERRFRETPVEGMAAPTTETSNLHALNQLGTMLEGMGTTVLRDDSENGDEPSTNGEFILVNNAVLDYPALQRLALESPLGQIAAQLFDSEKVNFLFDQIFIKQPGANTRTAFHQDQGYFHVDGEQIASFWTAAEPVAKENGAMGYVRGSHRWDLHSPNVFVGQATPPDAALPTLPDIEGNEADFDIVYFDVEPGDVIVHHYRTAHGARGNTSLDQPRRAVSLRYAGDDATVLHRGSAPPEFPTDPSLKDGDSLTSETYPLVWPRF